jgi:hypothetical protein
VKRGLWLHLLLLSCAPGITRNLHPPKEKLSIAAVVIYPPRITGEEVPSWRTYELGERLVTKAVAALGERLVLFGPTEVKVLRWEDDAWVASDAIALLTHSGVAPHQALVLRPSAEKRVGSQLAEAHDAKGKKRGGWATEETTWVVRVELLHPSSGHELIEVQGQVTVDPFARPTGEEEFDPAPSMTHLVERLVVEGLTMVEPFVAPRTPPPPLEVSFAQTPAGAAALPDPEVAKLDALGSELWIENRARFLTPTLSDRDAALVARSRSGLFVLDAPPTAAVKRGDVVIEVDGAAPLRQVLARKRLGFTPVPVRVQRGNLELDATVP